jgi:23S rRNA (cytidine1920-2'-O)/16S rRNA (cytidine1409-2'-O)-methyltransferase
VHRGLAETRTRAQALILAGRVRLGTTCLDKPGLFIRPDDVPKLTLTETLPYVSRGGLKLAHALEAFGISPEGQLCLDVGASTGGFTDCLLQRGAWGVVALDVGHGQLAWSLRQDVRVVSLEGANVRYLTPHTLWPQVEAAVAAQPAPKEEQQRPWQQRPWPPVSFITVDVSFISLAQVMPVLWALPEADTVLLVALLKPQFEYKNVFPNSRRFDGVVRDAAQREAVIAHTLDTLARQCPPTWQYVGHVPSPILGPKGNQETLVYWAKTPGAPGRPVLPLPT